MFVQDSVAAGAPGACGLGWAAASPSARRTVEAVVWVAARSSALHSQPTHAAAATVTTRTSAESACQGLGSASGCAGVETWTHRGFMHGQSVVGPDLISV